MNPLTFMSSVHLAHTMKMSATGELVILTEKEEGEKRERGRKERGREKRERRETERGERQREEKEGG